ncbi:xanthine dehydrogenase accessory protein XdhC [Ideonella livida]|uniref:Xanthine dehydrogenase accessory protein XdhC n=1 Tax=Ideonella livida TaxID=2707176 RepID=A0A7C9PFV1_9BURK|nr:xanthine dehydrogenase accessory protein XdhC [Ideonella livida]NDY90034.1 xanthine dehydrogenase accessory protein XdhC [Ideonella livida]
MPSEALPPLPPLASDDAPLPAEPARPVLPGLPGPTEADAALAAHWLAGGAPALVVEVIQARGSVPRPDGTRMLVSAGAVAGTVGGGHLEWQAILKARELLAAAPPGRPPAALDWPLALGPSLGQCCGGALTLRLRPLEAARVADWPAPARRFRLHLFGAGHVGRALARVLAELPCEVWWVDEREAEFPPGPLPSHLHPVCVESVEAEVDQARPGDAFLVLTHSHELDLRLTQAILKRGDFGWFGLIGSATKRARFERRLRERGIPEATLARLCCPIGLPGMTGKEPGVIAVAVAAQLLQTFPAPR